MADTILSVETLTKRFGGFTAVNKVSFPLIEARSSGSSGQRVGVYHLQHDLRHPQADRGPHQVSGPRGRRSVAEPDLPSWHRPDLPDPAPSGACRSRRTCGGRVLWSGRPWLEDGSLERGRARSGPRWPTQEPQATVDTLGAAGQKLELARALATGPELRWPTKAWAASTTRKWTRPPTCWSGSARDGHHHRPGGAHHGRAMRVVDRVMVLDHGEKIPRGCRSMWPTTQR